MNAASTPANRSTPQNSQLANSIFPRWLPSVDDQDRVPFWRIVSLIVLAGTLLRLVGLFDDFWLDEIWSWSFALSSKSIGQIFFGLHHDNNHYLNTLWIYLCGHQAHWFVYRLHSYFAGIAMIFGGGILAGDIAYSSCPAKPDHGRTTTEPAATAKSWLRLDRSNPAAFAQTNAMITMFLLATCHMAIVYSTEARGYALAATAGVFSTIVLRHVISEATEHRPSITRPFLYALLTIVGFLSHLLFATVFIPQLIWASFRLARRRAFWQIAACFLPAIMTLAVLWYFDLRFALVGGGHKALLLQVGLEAIALPTGAVRPDWLVLICSALVLIGLIQGLSLIRHDNPADTWLFVLLILLAPPLIVGVRSTDLLTPRHFFVLWMLLIPLLGLSLTPIAAIKRYRIFLVLAMMTVWMITNGWEFIQFAIYGRGGYQRSVEWLASEIQREKGDPKIYQIGSDHDFRNGMVLSFYTRRLPAKIPLKYIPQGQWPPGGVDWMILHDLDRDFQPEKSIQIGAWDYDLAHFEPFAAPIGFHWAIYRRRDPQQTQPSHP